MKNRIKRVFSVVLLLALMLSLLPHVQIFALETDGVIRIEQVTAEPGSTVEVDILVENNPGIYSLEFRAGFTSEYLTLTGFAYNPEFGGSGMVPPLGNRFSLSWYNNGAVEDVTTNGVLATLTFQLSQDAPEDQLLQIEFVSGSLECYNAADRELSVSLVGGGILVQSGIPGDINGDKKVTTRDVTRLHQYVVGWPVEVDLKAVDVNGDGKTTTRDVTRLHQYVVGWDVEVFYNGRSNKQSHTLQAVPAKEATCAEPGNIAYWTCAECGKFFSDANGATQVSLEDVIVYAAEHSALTEVTAKAPTCTEPGTKAHWYCSACDKYYSDAAAETEITKTQTVDPSTGHTEVVDQAIVPTYTQTGLTEGLHCKVCGEVILAQETVPMLPTTYHAITYRNLQGAESPAITQFAEHKGIAFEDVPAPVRPGYKFLGWWTASEDGTKIDQIEPGTTKNVTVFAQWGLEQYKITYVDASRNSNPKEYNVEQEILLSPAEWSGLTFNNWTNEKGEPVDKISKGSTGNITLYANWLYEENMAVPTKDSGIKTVVYDEEKNRYYFVYDLGVIDNVVLETIGSNDKDFGAELTLGREHVTSVEKSIADTVANTISQSVSNTDEWSKNFTNTETHEVNFELSGGLEKKDIFKLESKLGITNTTENSREYGEGGSNTGGTETSDSVSSSVSYTTGTSHTFTTTYVIPEDMPKGSYSYVCVGRVRVYGVVIYDPVEGKYYLDTYSVLDETLREKVLYEAPSTSTANISRSEGLPFDAYASEQEMLDYLQSVYNVNYNANGGSGTPMLSSVHKIGEKQNLLKKTYTREGHEFVGWGITPDGGALYPDEAVIDENVSGGEVITLYAIWQAKSYTASWNAATGATIKVQRKSSPYANAATGAISSGSTVYYGDVIVVTYTNNEGYTITQKGNDSIVVTGNLTALDIFATATANQYTIEYNANGGTGTTSASVHTYGQSKALTTNGFTRHGWKFQGWATSASSTTVVYTNGQSVKNLTSKSNGKIVLYAVWSVETKAIFNGGELYVKNVGEKGHAGDVANLLDVNALADQGYKYKITIKYNLQVDGDHLYAVTRLNLGSTEIFNSGKVYYDDDASGSPTYTISSRSASELRNNSYFELWFDAKGKSGFDVLNKFWVRNCTITFEFYK